MSYTLILSDSFNRANGGLSPSAFDNALGGSGSDVWSNRLGADYQITSNKAQAPATLGTYIDTAGALPATTGQKVTATIAGLTSSNGCGLICRHDGGGGELLPRLRNADRLFDLQV